MFAETKVVKSIYKCKFHIAKYINFVRMEGSDLRAGPGYPFPLDSLSTMARSAADSSTTVPMRASAAALSAAALSAAALSAAALSDISSPDPYIVLSVSF